MALFRTPLTNDLPSLMVEVCLVLAPDVNFSLIHANRGCLLAQSFFLFEHSFNFNSSLNTDHCDKAVKIIPALR